VQWPVPPPPRLRAGMKHIAPACWVSWAELLRRGEHQQQLRAGPRAVAAALAAAAEEHAPARQQSQRLWAAMGLTDPPPPPRGPRRATVYMPAPQEARVKQTIAEGPIDGVQFQQYDAAAAAAAAGGGVGPAAVDLVWVQQGGGGDGDGDGGGTSGGTSGGRNCLALQQTARVVSWLDHIEVLSWKSNLALLQRRMCVDGGGGGGGVPTLRTEVIRGVQHFRNWCRVNLLQRGVGDGVDGVDGVDGGGVWIVKDALSNGGEVGTSLLPQPPHPDWCRPSGQLRCGG
jgi:hypothetical protein